MHVSGGLSLKQTAVRARELGLAKVSSVALHKRLKKAEEWLARLTKHLLSQGLAGAGRADRLRPVRVIDATDIQEPGSTGTFLRLHYSLTLPDLRAAQKPTSRRKGPPQIAG